MVFIPPTWFEGLLFYLLVYVLPIVILLGISVFLLWKGNDLFLPMALISVIMIGAMFPIADFVVHELRIMGLMCLMEIISVQN